jgi:NAD(P)-dependent dehydrogenase (short-subunit alcohol dehydrogenase family)
MPAPGTIVVAGYGPGISSAVAILFGKQGYKVALLARTQSKLDAAVAGESPMGAEVLRSNNMHRRTAVTIGKRCGMDATCLLLLTLPSYIIKPSALKCTVSSVPTAASYT